MAPENMLWLVKMLGLLQGLRFELGRARPSDVPEL